MEQIDSLFNRAAEIYDSDLERYSDLIQQAMALAEHHGDTRSLARSLLNRSRYHQKKLNLDEARNDIASAERLIATLQESEADPLRLDVATALGPIHYASEDYEEAARINTEALRLARELNLPDAVARIHQDLAACLTMQGKNDEAVEHFIHAVRLSPVKDGTGYALALVNLATLCMGFNDLASARAYLEEALSCSITGTWLEALCATRIADVFGCDGKPELALPWAERAVQIARSYGEVEYIIESLLTLSDAYLALGNIPAAIEGFEELRTLAQSPSDIECALHRLALIHARIGAGTAGEFAETLSIEPIAATAKARAYVEEAEGIMDQVDPQRAGGSLRHIAEVYAILGEQGKAYEALRKSLDLGSREYSTKVRDDASSLRHLLRVEREEHEKEIQRMKAEQTERELGNITLQLLAQTELLRDLRGDLLKMVRKIPPSEPVARELRERIKNLPCDAVDWKKFDTQFERAHPEFIRTLTERAPDLTVTEVRICTMVRMNLKSHEIASLFCITEEGVEFHRRNVRRKLKLNREEKLPIVLGAM
jgi:tetratricopeptide (TPR) repeat protein/DNA-binding CsgD family transcriptional regulator